MSRRWQLAVGLLVGLALAPPVALAGRETYGFVVKVLDERGLTVAGNYLYAKLPASSSQPAAPASGGIAWVSTTSDLGYVDSSSTTTYLNAAYGSMHITSDAGVALSANTPAKIASVTEAGQLRGFTHSNGRLTYVGPQTRTFSVSVTLSLESNSASQSKIYIAKDGAVESHSEIRRTISTPTDDGAIATNYLTKASCGDYFEIWVESDGNDTFTVPVGTLIIVALD